jgi:hypothetical protein
LRSAPGDPPASATSVTAPSQGGGTTPEANVCKRWFAAYKARARPASQTLKSFTMLILIAISAFALRLLLSLPNGIVH